MRHFEYRINFKPPSKALTRQQQVVCDLIMEGLTTKQIARKLGICPRSVDDHKKAIYTKMEVQGAVQLIRKIYEARIAELTSTKEHDGEVIERAMAAIERAIENRWPR